MARVGFEARLKINDLPLDIIGDIEIGEEWSEVEVKNRKSRDVTFLRALRTRTLELEIENNKEDPALQALKSANNTESPVTVTLTEDDSDTDPYTAQYIVTKFSKSYPLEDKMAVSVTLKPSAYPSTP